MSTDGPETVATYDPRPYGYVKLFRRGTHSVAFIVPKKAVEDANLKEGTGYRIFTTDDSRLATKDSRQLTLHPAAEETDPHGVGPLPDEKEIGQRTLRTDGSSHYFTLPKKALEELGLGLGDGIDLRASPDGTILIQPW